MANFHLSGRRKRGPQPSSLSVRLFLLDPDNKITKVTKETCSKEGIKQLMQKGYGPPQPEHCVSDDKVEFSLELTNEQFKQKLVEIYPKLENACFVFMKADKNNKLEELNHGMCCFQCYTPENVYHSERGQGRLYIQKIAENEISQCTHGVSRFNGVSPGYNQQRFVPIQPKLPKQPKLPAVCTITGVSTESSTNVVRPVATSANNQLPVSGTNGIESRPLLVTPGAIPVLDLTSTALVNSSGNIVPQSQLLSSAIVPQTESTPPVYSTVNISTQSQLSSAVVSQTTSSQPVNVIPQNLLPTSTIASQAESNPPFPSYVNMVTQDQLQLLLAMFSQNVPRSTAQIPVNMVPQNLSQTSTSFVPRNTSASLFDNSVNMITQNQLPAPITAVSWTASRPTAQVTSLSSVTAIEQDLAQLGATFEARRAPPMAGNDGNVNISMLQASETGFQWMQSPGLVALADAIDAVQRGEWIPTDANISNEQGNLDLQVPVESLIDIDSFLENVKSTGKLETSSSILDNDDLMEKLNASTINIRTVEIESTCKLHQALRIFSLPSCLMVLNINDNNLNDEDIFALIRSLSSVNNLHELNLSRTKFKESSFISFLRALISCSSLRKLRLTDNGLTKQEINFLSPAFESMKDLVNLNLCKNNLTETQTNNILQKLEDKSIVCLDISQNALQGNEVIIGICHLQSLEELNLSHNHIRFFPLPNLEKQHDHLPINTSTISLSSNHMTDKDVCLFFSLITSDLLKLNLDCNHVGSSIWSLCSLRIKHLTVLSLANTDICGPAVNGLAFLLSLVGELEELNLSSNNLVLADFRQLQSPLSNLTQLKRLNLSNNPDGISVVLHEILPSLKYLEELRLSNVHLNGGDLNKTCDSFASLKGLKHLDLSRNAIGPDGTRALANILKEFPLLEGLDMSKSCIKEDEISVLCKGLVPLNRLKYLNLSGNRIDIEVLGDALFLPPMLEELIFEIIHGGKLFANMSPLQHLRKLHLSEIKLRPCDVVALTAMLSSFPLLEELVLAKTVCTDCEKIFSAIKSLKNIKKIDLTGITIPDGNAIAEMLASLLTLEELVLANMNVANKRDGIIFSKMKLLKNLRKLDLNGIRIWDKKAFFDMLSSFPFSEGIVLNGIALLTDDITGLFCTLKSLRYLKNLDLRGIFFCSMVEDFARVLPSLQLLEKLVLGICFDFQKNKKPLFAAVGKLTYLKELKLKDNTITQAGADSLAEVLPSLQLLEKLVLENVYYYDDDDDDIDDESKKQLFAAVGKLTYLKELELRSIKITQATADSLAEVLPSLQLLEKLVLENDYYYDDIDDESKKQLFAAVGKLTYLKELELRYIRTGADSLAEVLPSLQLLEKLVLEYVDYDYDDIDDESKKQLFAAVGKLTYLKELELRNIRTTQAGSDSLAEVLPSLQLLEKLVLENFDVDDDIDDESKKQLFAAVGKLTYLKELELKYIKITQAGADSLAEVLPSLQPLEKLSLTCLNFSNISDQQLFTAVGSLSCLKKLYLFLTKTTYAGAEILIDVLPSFRNLTAFTLPTIHETLKSRLKAAASLIPGLKVHD